MGAETNEQAANHDDVSEELRDVLIAISVVAKRLASKLETKQTTEGEKE